MGKDWKITGEVNVAKMRKKRANPAADTRALETEIDQLVYGLYGLSPSGMITEDEIKIVEGRSI
jgi:hypothetical protein